MELIHCLVLFLEFMFCLKKVTCRSWLDHVKTVWQTWVCGTKKNNTRKETLSAMMPQAKGGDPVAAPTQWEV